ncbi:hypothetical protein BN1723_018617, partial [Verticillium longisporum]
QP